MSYLTTSNLSVMINGERLDPFLPFCGIRQGNPLSPYIFILCMEYLAELITTEISLGNWSSIKTSRDGPSFSHLLFADNLILFNKVTKKNCLAINKVLETFYTISGQQVNYGKSKLFFSTHTSEANATMVEKELGMERTKDFGKYLDVPIISDGWNKRAFNLIVEKIQAKLSSWKSRSLSMAGWLVLINSITLAMPTHLMQCTLLPVKICHKLDKINQDFL